MLCMITYAKNAEIFLISFAIHLQLLVWMIFAVKNWCFIFETQVVVLYLLHLEFIKLSHSIARLAFNHFIYVLWVLFRQSFELAIHANKMHTIHLDQQIRILRLYMAHTTKEVHFLFLF